MSTISFLLFVFNRDGRLQKGDEILMINGHTLMAVTHQDVVDILRNSGSIVQLVIARKVAPWVVCSLLFFHSVQPKEKYNYSMHLLKIALNQDAKQLFLSDMEMLCFSWD